MILSSIQAFIGFLITILTALFILRPKNHKKGVTRCGQFVFMLALGLLVTSLVKAYVENENENKAPFSFKLEDINLTLYAKRNKAFQIDSEILASTPRAIAAEYLHIGKFTTRTEFVRVPTVDRPWGYRSLPKATLIYHAKNLRPHSLENHEDFPYKYLWDLDGISVVFRLPLHRFKSEGNEFDWEFAAELRIGGNGFLAEPDKKGNFEIKLNGLDKKTLLSGGI